MASLSLTFMTKKLNKHFPNAGVYAIAGFANAGVQCIVKYITYVASRGVELLSIYPPRTYGRDMDYLMHVIPILSNPYLLPRTQQHW